MQNMEFPNEIWKEIMNYFHSSYKLPLHYISLIENNQFYFSRKKNLRNPIKNIRSCLVQRRCLSEMEKVYNSFYMTVILTSGNTTIKNKSCIQLKRQTAASNILEDFVAIFNEYKNQNLQILANIKY